MIGSTARVALFGLLACTPPGRDDVPPVSRLITAAAPAPAIAPPAPAPPVSAPAPVPTPVPVRTVPVLTAFVPTPDKAFPPFETTTRLDATVANLSATSCIVAWPAQSAQHEVTTFLFRSDDSGASFQVIGEVDGQASDIVALDGRIWLLKNTTGDVVAPAIEYSDDGGLSWKAEGALEAAIASDAPHEDPIVGMAFRDRLVGTVRLNRERWLETADGGDNWHPAPARPEWKPPPRRVGPCTFGHVLLWTNGSDAFVSTSRKDLQRRTPTGDWERVPGAP